MQTSITRTFREEGSPAGSWPALAVSTMRKKGYSAGHKLLILSGKLFGSITYVVNGGVLTIGTDRVYAAVQQWGSRDYAPGPRTQAQSLAAVHVRAFDYVRKGVFQRYGTRLVVDKLGRRSIRRGRVVGPAPAPFKVQTKEHERHQNIPPRPYLVFRPEDPDLIAVAFESYIHGRLSEIGFAGLA